MVGVCQEAVLTGTCNRRFCPFQHNLHLFCRACTRSCHTVKEMKYHVKTREHKETLKKCAAYCNLCNEVVDDDISIWQEHCKSSRHVEAAGQSSDWFDQPFPTYREVTPPPYGSVRCIICHVDVLEGQWLDHVGLQPHRMKRLLTVIPRWLRRRREKPHGVTVSHFDGGLDFGIIEDKAGSIQKGLTIRVNANSLRLVKADITSVTEGTSDKDTSVFTTSVASRPLRRGETITVNVCFTPRGQPGIFSDRVEVYFFNNATKGQFAVWRILKGEVGDRKELEKLAPKSAYVPPPPRMMVPDDTFATKGPPPPNPFAVRWKNNPKEYKVPEDLINLLSTGSRKGLTEVIKQTFIPRGLTLSSFGAYWQTLLWIEEEQQKIDLLMYSMTRVKLTKRGKYYYVPIPGLAEKRPSVVRGDLIKVNRQSEKDVHGGYVHKVERAGVLVAMHENFTKRTWGATVDFDVNFTLNRLPFRRQHQAVLMAAEEHRRILFPERKDLRGSHNSIVFDPVNPEMKKNDSQLKAVGRILAMPPGSPPFIIFGPPGTGKTTTLVEAIHQLCKANPNARVLACAPSNAAADVIGARLASLGQKRLFRMNATTRDYLSATEDPSIKVFLDTFALTGLDETDDEPRRVFRHADQAQLISYGVVVSTCVTAGVPHALGVPRGHFDWIFLDEAVQTSEPEALISLLTMIDHKTNVVLCGDPRQLGPVIHSEISKALGHSQSFMERLMKLEMYDDQGPEGKAGLTVVKLKRNFRNHVKILKFPNDRFYNGELIACAKAGLTNKLLKWKDLPNKEFPILFFGIQGKDEREESSPSYFNPQEILQVKKLVLSLMNDRNIKGKNIGIIAPYSQQCIKLRRQLTGALYNDIKIGSVEEFQGQERTVIIISTTRSQPDNLAYDLRHTLGFVAAPRRLNVAITRAQSGLIIVGNPKVLSLDPVWRSLLNYIAQNDGWGGSVKPDWDTSEEVNFDDETLYARVRNQQAVSRMDALENRLRGVVFSRRGADDEERFDEEEKEIVLVSTTESRVGWRDNV